MTETTTTAGPDQAPAEPRGTDGRLTVIARRAHVWVGLLTAFGVIIVTISGVLLNHIVPLGLGRKGAPAVQGTGSIADVAPLNDLLKTGERVAGEEGAAVITPQERVYSPTGPGDINRMVLRPKTKTAQVLLDDVRHTEAILDWSTARVLQVAPRDDIALEQFHTGEVAGQKGVVITDIIAVALVLLTVTGVWSWLRRLRARKAAVTARETRWVRVNWWFHLAGGLAVAVYLVVLSVTGVLLNHKREWGFMKEPFRAIPDEVVARSEPGSLETIMQRGIAARSDRRDLTFDDVNFVDYRPPLGYAKVRFKDGEWEAIVDVYNDQVYSVAHRRDIWIEDLHAGLWFGAHGWLISEVVGIVLILLTVNGLYIWVLPTWRARSTQTMGESTL